MIKKIIVSFSLLLSLVSFAQSTSSPYSFYGIGDVRFKGTVENRSMAGLSIVPDSIHLNLQNPAQYASLKYISFAVAGTFSANRLSNQTQTEKAQRTTLDYLAVGIPAKKVSLAFGLIPYSAVGYRINSFSTDGTTLNQYLGTGGINKVFLGFGFKVTKKINIGVDAQYNFGRIETNSTEFVNGLQYATNEKNTSNAGGLNFNTGITYNTKVSKKITLYTAATFTPQAIMRFKNERRIYTQTISGSLVDYLDVPVVNTRMKMPTKYTFGFGLGEMRKWAIGTEVSLQNNSGFGNRFNDINAVNYGNAAKITVGGYFIPSTKNFSKYFSKVVYRAGFRYENTGLIINDQKIKDGAVTFGFGMPLRGTFSNINIGCELGSRGTAKANLIRENYANISIGLSLNDKWFQRRKYE
ncbi:hypothetical protein OX284_007070 [Flavobacterium sp. SUN046]|uniref:hypothetical protein n=1 Tax=Flavobacterium sp. SUN046 TaxID=3002440 RepID=UPI002DBA15E1|nr:hypothetical protein [Flavobacterium sp. SUN046]MEC4049185.1 hypothetical protein [Flavobacterium sp. SUN046]